MGIFETLACIVAHAPNDAEFLASDASEDIEYQQTDKIPGWDQWLDDNSVAATVVNRTTGRVRGRAWGVSNPSSNFRSVVEGRLRFEFILSPANVLLPQERYQFSVDIETKGRFLHAPAVPYPGDPREPPALTVSQLESFSSIFQLLPNGGVQAIAPRVRVLNSSLPVGASQSFEETIDRQDTVRRDFFPGGQNPIVFRIERNVAAAATGKFSDIRIRGSEGRRNFRVRALNPRVQKVLEAGDPCFAVLNPR